MKEYREMKKEKENQMKKSSDEAYINKFNSEIINNKDWGKEDDDPLKAQQKLREEMKKNDEILLDIKQKDYLEMVKDKKLRELLEMCLINLYQSIQK